MHSRITNRLRLLNAKKETNRKQIAKWLSKSLSYVDQRFQDTEDWAGEDVDIIIQKAFELHIHELLELWVPDTMSLIDWDGMKMFLNGNPDDEFCEIITIASNVRNGKGTVADKEKLHTLIEQMYKEVS